MRNILFILLLLPFALFAQTDWNRSPYDQPESVEETSEEPEAYPDLDPKTAGGDPLIVGLEKGWFSSGLLHSKIYMYEGDTIRADRVEPMVAGIPKAKDEITSAKRWGYGAYAFALVAIVSVNLWAYGSGDLSAGAGIATLGGLFLEGYCVRQANNHYNAAVDMYNARLKGEFGEESGGGW